MFHKTAVLLDLYLLNFPSVHSNVKYRNVHSPSCTSQPSANLPQRNKCVPPRALTSKAAEGPGPVLTARSSPPWPPSHCTTPTHDKTKSTRATASRLCQISLTVPTESWPRESPRKNEGAKWTGPPAFARDTCRRIGIHVVGGNIVGGRRCRALSDRRVAIRSGALVTVREACYRGAAPRYYQSGFFSRRAQVHKCGKTPNAGEPENSSDRIGSLNWALALHTHCPVDAQPPPPSRASAPSISIILSPPARASLPPSLVASRYRGA